MTTKFQRNLRTGYGFSLFMLLCVGLISYLTLHNLIKSNKAVAHSSEVMQKFEKLLSVMIDAETGQRGYLLSGKANFLEPYNGAYQEASTLSTELKLLTADNPNQQINLSTIDQILQQRLIILQKLIVKKQHGEAITDVDLNAGKMAMDDLRLSIAKAEQNEKELLKERTAILDTYIFLTPLFIIIAALIAIGITFYSYRNVMQDVREKEILRDELKASEEETQALNEELTTANEEIMAANEEVMAANEELTAINEELLEAREELSNSNILLEQRVADRTNALLESEGKTQALNEELIAINEEITATNEDLAESQQQLRALLDELRQAEERSAKLAAIVESSDDAIIGKDLDGVITAWNRGAQQIFGYSETDMIGSTILKLIPEDLQHEEPFILGKLRKGEKIDHYETIRQTADGRLINVSLTISPIHDNEGRVIGVSKIARDITEQKRDEQRKNDFIGMASHELKTPLTSLSALIQVLQLKLKVHDDPFVPQALVKAKLQAQKMSSLINGFLNVSRLESGKIEIVKEEFDLSELVIEQLDEIRLTVSSHTFVFEPIEPVTVIADHEKVGSVISNLLSNAVKYSPKGKMINVSCTINNGLALFKVQDEGMGIKAEDLPHVFERYYRADSSHTKTISGFGVGLYLSAEIIHRHEGEIWAESKKGVGSTFFFTLPLA